MGIEDRPFFRPEDTVAQKLGSKDETQEIVESVSTPEAAMQRLFSEMDELEFRKALPLGKSIFLEEMVALLRDAVKIEDPRSYKLFRDEHFQKLGISSKYLIRNSFDRGLHERILAYLNRVGIHTTDEEKQEIKKFFAMRDNGKRKLTLDSYAHHGLLTIKTALDKGVLKETSATPGDFSAAENLHSLPADTLNTVRGYELADQDMSDDLFYGRNGFFGVSMERGGEDIDRASQIPKGEVENRLRNSVVFVVSMSKLDGISRRTENVHKEDIVGRDIQPKEIDYVIVDKSNLALAQQAFGRLSAKVVGADFVKADIAGLYDGSYVLPDYKKELVAIVKAGDPIWCHIARLPTDTYPDEVP